MPISDMPNIGIVWRVSIARIFLHGVQLFFREEKVLHRELFLENAGKQFFIKVLSCLRFSRKIVSQTEINLCSHRTWSVERNFINLDFSSSVHCSKIAQYVATPKI